MCCIFEVRPKFPAERLGSPETLKEEEQRAKSDDNNPWKGEPRDERPTLAAYKTPRHVRRLLVFTWRELFLELLADLACLLVQSFCDAVFELLGGTPETFVRVSKLKAVRFFGLEGHASSSRFSTSLHTSAITLHASAARINWLSGVTFSVLRVLFAPVTLAIVLHGDCGDRHAVALLRHPAACVCCHTRWAARSEPWRVATRKGGCWAYRQIFDRIRVTILRAGST